MSLMGPEAAAGRSGGDGDSAAGGPRPVLSVDGGLRLKEVNELLAALHRQPEVDLRVAYKLRHRGLLVTASVCQLVLTWAARTDGRLLSHWQGNPVHLATEMDRLVSGDHGLLAVLAARDVTDVRGEVSLLDEAAAKAAARLAPMSRFLPLGAMERGARSLALVCDDRGGRGTPTSLYRRGPHGPSVRSEDEFIDLMRWIMRYRQEQRPKGRGQPVLPAEEFENAVAGVLYELFRNTQDWAVFEADSLSLIHI